MLKERVASLCFKCFRCFIGMLQVFYMDAAKVDRDDAYVAIVVYVCCKLLFPMFHLFFQTYVVSVFIWMLHMLQVFYLDVAYILQWFSKCFSSVSDACFKCFNCL